MIDPKKLEEIAKQVHNSLPPGIRSMGEEAEKKMRQVLQAQLGKLAGECICPDVDRIAFNIPSAPHACMDLQGASVRLAD